MTIDDLRKNPHLSASSIESYIDCGLSYRFSRIDKLKPEFLSDNMEFGKCIHQALADFHQERMIGTILTRDQLQERFIYHWTIRASENEQIKYRPENNYQSILEMGKSLMKTYHDNFNDHKMTVLAIEQPFSFTIDGLPVPVIGVMDLVEENEQDIIITDFKTAAKSYTEKDVNKNPQLTIYQLASRANGYSDRKIILKLDCLIKTKVAQFKRYYTRRNRLDEIKAEKKIIQVWKGIAKGVFIPNDTSWKCQDCFYSSACDDWYRGEAA